MRKTITLKDNRSVTIVSAESVSVTITNVEIEMDTRAREAVKSAIHKAKTCKKPIARYDRLCKRAYIENEDGVKTYV